MEDATLIAACASGDTRALQILHARHASAAFSFAWRMLGNEADADEVVADAFYEVWRQAGRFAGRSKVRTWILGIVRHKALDVLRSRQQFADNALSEDDLVSIVDDNPTPYEWLVEHQRMQVVAACMDALPAPQKECLHLALVEGMTIAEIARVVGVPDNTVATRIHHAKRKLKDCVARATGLKNQTAEGDSLA
ncbi:ECF RNA polymerase sigma factor SigE [Tepidimonas thermarum]|uniref:ECF RNA polymerase sigma factor SigE n=1 Tax=Tepidimonas thermarum TaxID=335431 RepID=A0A554WVS3_9BURK|nr:sigma-70 family RNA polymerase sigma factor [Tepidimonas thermarum]TSE27663.1 ECF RNA polymerase sigma factor SigE [Tepidimonas thermarum]